MNHQPHGISEQVPREDFYWVSMGVIISLAQPNKRFYRLNLNKREGLIMNKITITLREWSLSFSSNPLHLPLVR